MKKIISRRKENINIVSSVSNVFHTIFKSNYLQATKLLNEDNIKKLLSAAKDPGSILKVIPS